MMIDYYYYYVSAAMAAAIITIKIILLLLSSSVVVKTRTQIQCWETRHCPRVPTATTNYRGTRVRTTFPRRRKARLYNRRPLQHPQS